MTTNRSIRPARPGIPARTVRLALAALVAFALAGCVSIPRSGPVVRADQATTRPSSQVQIAPQPPPPDATPRTIVEGFLQAMAGYEPDYATARAYLTPAVRDSWRPSSGITVYADGSPLTETDAGVLLQAPVTGRVDARGAYSPVTDELATDFGLQRNTDGQWRISEPPQGLLVSQFVFENFFQHVNLYWPEPDSRFLVPDPVSVAQGRSSPTTLVESLLAGPGDWIAPAVTSAFPLGTRLNRPVALDDRGVATVDLSGQVDLLDASQRRVLAGQLVWTLRQIPTVTAVRVLHDGVEYALGDLTEEDGTVTVKALPAMSPVPTTLETHLYGVSDGRVVRVEQSDQTARLAAIAGPFGQPGVGVEQVAVSVPGDAAAVVTAGGSRVTGIDLVGGATTFSFFGFTALQRPQYARTGELWLLSGEPGAHRVQTVVDGALQEVEIGALARDTITSFRLSPDGVRLALVIERDGRSVLAMARVERGPEGLRVDGMRVVPLVTTVQTELTDTVDVGWIGPGRLVVLAAALGANQPSPYRLDPNAISVTQIGQADRWQATRIATLANPETTRVVVIGEQARAWRYEDDFTWPQLSQNLTAAAYPG